MTKPLLSLLMTVLLVPTAIADMHDQHRWKDRVLVLVAPSEDNAGLQKQRQMIQARQDAIADRNLRIYELTGSQGSLDQQTLQTDDVTALRQHLGLAPEDRLMILLGLDGEVKRRAPLDTPLSDFFRQIDRMPMRQADIRAKRAAGMTVTKP